LLFVQTKILEYVKLSDGTEGTIASIGLLETEIIGSDHVPVRVPNTHIIGKKVSLYSKITKSQVNVSDTVICRYFNLYS
jgi:small-conductance mechanosensitive channel